MTTESNETSLYSIEAEMATVGSIMIDALMIDELGFLQPADFRDSRHQAIFQTMRQVWTAGEPIDIVSVGDVLPEHRLYLLDLVTATPTHVNAVHYGRRVQRYSIVRSYVAMAQQLVEKAYGGETPDTIYAWLNEALRQMRNLPGGSRAWLDWEDSFELYAQILLERQQAATVETNKWTWPWRTWNTFIDPPEAGMLAVVSAGDGQGKTIYAECIAEHWARQGRHVVFVHFELNRKIMLDRRMCRHANLERRILLNPLARVHQDAIDCANERLQTWTGNIDYLHCPGWTVEQVCSELRLRIADHRCDAFVVDYLEKARPSQKQVKIFGNNRYAHEADNIEQLKDLSEETETRSVILEQFSKAGKQTSFESLDRTGIRGAGEKTERANIVVLLLRDKVENGEFGPRGETIVEPGGYSREVKVRIDKNTMGKTGDFCQYLKAETFNVFDQEVA